MANILLDCWLMHVCMTLITQTVLPPVIMSSSSASCIWQRRLWSFAFRSALALSFPSHTLRGPNVAGMPKCFYVFGAPHTSCKRRCPHPQRLLLSPSAHGFDFSALSLSPALPLLWYFSSVTTARSVVFFCFFFVFGLESETLVLFLILILAFARETTTATRWRRTRRAQRGSVLNWRRANASGSGRISYSHRDIKMSSAMSRASSLMYVPGSRWMWPYPWS